MKRLETTEPILKPTPENFYLGVLKEVWVDDKTGEKKIYFKYFLPDVAQVMGITTDGKIIVVGEFQPGLGKNYPHLVGETIEKDESPLAAAQRGLREETGYESKEFELISSVLQDTGRSDRLIHLFVAHNCRRATEGEKDITITLMKPRDFWESTMSYFMDNPTNKHGGGNSLKLATLAFQKMRLLKLELT